MSALLYFATAVATLAAVRRGAPLSLRAAAVIALLPLCFTGRALLTGRIYAPLDLAYTQEPLASVARQAGVGAVANPALSDVYAQFVPWRAAFRASIARHQWPLWNPYELGGDPLAGAAQVAPYHPLTLLCLLIPLADALTFLAAMTLFLAALTMFLFLRELECDEVAALLGAAGWAMSTFLLSFILTALALTICVAPLLFLAARRIARAPSLRSATVLVLALTLITLAGHPETEMHAVVLAAVYALFELRRDVAPRAVAYALGAGAVTLLLCAIHLAPLLEALPQTREYRHRAGSTSREAVAPVSEALRADFIPFADTDGHHAWFGSSYAGAILFVPCVAAGALARRRREVWFFLALALFGILAGASVLAPILDRLPLFNLAVNTRLIGFGAFGICVLAALGASADVVWLRRSAVAVFIALAIGIAFTPLTDQTPSFFRVSAARELIPIALLIALLSTIRVQHAALALLALLLLQRTIEMHDFVPTIDRRAMQPPIARLDQLAQTPEPFRVVGQGMLFTPNLATLFGLEDVRGYQAMTLARFAQTFPLWSEPQAVWSNRVDDLTAPMLSLMNVRYAVAPADMPPPSGWRNTGAMPGAALFENMHVLPRAFIPRTIHLGGASLDDLRACRDFGADAWIETHEPRRTTANGTGSLTVRADGGRLEMHASIRSPGWIVVSEPAWSGWRVERNGQRIRAEFADIAFLAFYLPQGESDIVMRYLPKGFVAGAWISGITALLLLAFGVRRLAAAFKSRKAAASRRTPIYAARRNR